MVIARPSLTVPAAPPAAVAAARLHLCVRTVAGRHLSSRLRRGAAGSRPLCHARRRNSSGRVAMTPPTKAAVRGSTWMLRTLPCARMPTCKCECTAARACDSSHMRASTRAHTCSHTSVFTKRIREHMRSHMRMHSHAQRCGHAHMHHTRSRKIWRPACVATKAESGRRDQDTSQRRRAAVLEACLPSKRVFVMRAYSYLAPEAHRIMLRLAKTDRQPCSAPCMHDSLAIQASVVVRGRIDPVKNAQGHPSQSRGPRPTQTSRIAPMGTLA